MELLFRPDKNIERRPDLWVVERMQYTEDARGEKHHRVVARLRPGVTLRQAQSQADAVAGQIRGTSPGMDGTGFQIRLEPMQQYLVAALRPAILALMGAVIFLLLIACSNVANLFLVRASLRARDLAVRTALGASWWRLARQVLAEALLVSAMGSALGFGLAWAGVHQLLAIAPAELATPGRHPHRSDGTGVQYLHGVDLGRIVRSGAGLAGRTSGCGAGLASQRAYQRSERRRTDSQCGGSRRGGSLFGPAGWFRLNVPQFPDAATHRYRIRRARRVDLPDDRRTARANCRRARRRGAADANGAGRDTRSGKRHRGKPSAPGQFVLSASLGQGRRSQRSE